MKNRIFSLLTAILCVLIIASFAAADAGMYPIGQQQPQSYPVPQYMQPQQQPQQQPNQQQPYYGYANPYYNNPYYNNPYYANPYYNNPYYNNPYYNNPYGNQAPTQVPQQNHNNQQQGPYYGPNSGYYFQPQHPQNPWGSHPYNQGDPNSNVQVSAQWKYDGTLDLTWTIKNVTSEDWGKKNIDIKCTGGTYLLTDPNRTLWDLPYTVNRNDRLTFTVNIRQPGPYDDAMTFAIVAGSKTLYTFSVRPR